MESSASFVSRNLGFKRLGSTEISQNEEVKRMKLDTNAENCEEESYISKLLSMVLDCIIQLKNISENEVRNSISSIISQFQQGSPRGFSNVNLKKWENICGYFFRYGLHGASLTRIRVLEAIENSSVVQHTIKKSHLRVISLGGGPGNDVIGLCSAFQDNKVQSDLKVTVVDKIEEWSLCVNLAKSFIPEGQFGNVTEFFHHNNVDLSFLKVQLPGNKRLYKDYFRKLVKADIILMVKLMSSLDWNSRKKIIASLHREMKQDAIIFLIDSPFHEDLWNHFDVLYLSDNDNYFQPSYKIERFQSSNDIKSKARIAVLRKKQIYETERVDLC